MCTLDKSCKKLNDHPKGECAHCGVSKTGLLDCSRCHLVAYCDRDCQRSHWKAVGGHKLFCVSLIDRDKKATLHIGRKHKIRYIKSHSET
jgi:hypothetical protein